MTNKKYAEGLLQDCINTGLLSHGHEIKINLGGLIRRNQETQSYSIIYHAATYNEVSGFLAGILYNDRSAFPKAQTILARATHITTKGFGGLVKEGIFCVISKHLSDDKVLIKTQNDYFYQGNIKDLTPIPEIENNTSSFIQK